MKICPSCSQPLAQELDTCPTCGNLVREGRKQIDEYIIEAVLSEGQASTVCRARERESGQPVTLRIFKPKSGVDEAVVKRLTKEFDQLRTLPQDYFVRQIAIRKSSNGSWYLVNEWIDALHWGALLSSGRLKDLKILFTVFKRITAILEGLHLIGQFMRHLTLEDIIAYSGEGDEICIKINYKPSRFLLAPAKSSGSAMLKKLFTTHPDIIKQRSIDFRSDIWSLGKIFVELLKGDLEIDDVRKQVDTLDLPSDATALLKSMLADDPELRPHSMSEISETLTGLIDSVDQWQQEAQARKQALAAPQSAYRRFMTHPAIIASVILLIIGLGVWVYFLQKPNQADVAFSRYANLYSDSIGFVLSDYWLKSGPSFVYRNRTEGTAFLVDNQGHLLSNRHVICPWLEDQNLLMLVADLKGRNEPVDFGFEVYLWFQGAKAFKRLPEQASSLDAEDHYFLDAAFSTGGKKRLTIVGVARSPQKAWQLAKSPLKNDFAVIKIDKVPEGLKPLPLAKDMDTLKVPKLSPLIALGFPLGSRTQSDTVNVSVTRGNVRRTFVHSIQVDTSIHSGNSGGPMIDINGQVVGIASSVAVSWARGPVPVATMLSDIGMVLPISKVTPFLEELKAGQLKWNGIFDLSLEDRLDRIITVADTRQWDKARLAADAELDKSLHPDIVMAAAVMRFCDRDFAGAGRLFKQQLSIASENDSARFMLYLIGQMTGDKSGDPYRKALLDADWRSPAEFFGYLVLVYEDQIPQETAIKGAYDDNEQAWLDFVAGFKQARQNNYQGAERLLKAGLDKADVDHWLYYLTLAELDHVQKQRLARLKSKQIRRSYGHKTAAFYKELKQNREKAAKTKSAVAPLLTKLELPNTTEAERETIQETLLERNKTNGAALSDLLYHNAKTERWNHALKYAKAFLKINGRENGRRLRIGLMEPQILHKLGQKDEARASLKRFIAQVSDPWYRMLAESLLKGDTLPGLLHEADENAINLVTAHTALGFWAESDDNRQQALAHYKVALSSYRDDMPEYEFAVNRIGKLQE